MKIFVVGNFRWPHYQQALLDGFNSMGGDIKAYPIILKYYPVWNIIGILSNTFKLWKTVKETSVDAVFLYRVDFIFPWILPIMRRLYGLKILVYHNDDPYKKSLRCSLKHFFFLRSLQYSDITYVYRKVNLSEAQKWGAHKVKIMRSYYYSKIDNLSQEPIDISQKDPCIIFIGHYEEDSRINYLNALFQGGINVHIYGHTAWKQAFFSHKWPLSHLHAPVYNKEYRDKLSSVYAALAFFSEKNRDDYTRRCFEIPMAHTLLFAPRTHYMNQTFTDGKNVILFDDTKDIVEKAHEIINNPQKTNDIISEGHSFVLNGGFSEKDAAKMIINDVNSL